MLGKSRGGGVGQSFLGGEARSGLILVPDVVTGKGVSGGFDTLQIDLVQLVEVLENIPELGAKFFLFFIRQLDAGEVGDVIDVELGCLAHDGWLLGFRNGG